jgi:hypothetical protein
MRVIITMLAIIVIVASCYKFKNRKGMQPSTINLVLLAKVPFFQSFNQEQLQWVKDNANEFHFSKNDVLKDFEQTAEDYWILLDGGWEISTSNNHRKQIDHSITSFVSPIIEGKIAGKIKYRITESSYILRITPEKMEELKKIQPLVADYIVIGNKKVEEMFDK